MAEAGFGAYFSGSERVIPDKRDLRDYWMEISFYKDFLGLAPSYVFIRDPVRRLCHRMIACSIFGRGQALEKVTGVDIFYLYGMDQGTANVLYLLTQHLFMHAEGRKSGASLGGSTSVRAAEDAPTADKGAQAIPAPMQAPQPPPPAPQHRVIESSITEQTRVSTWMISCMTQLMDANGRIYQAFNSTLVGSLWMSYQRRVRPRTGDPSTSTAPHTDDQLDP
ncbi:hypothetical protein Tco_0453460 [Tanacetum coccineum]